MSNHVLQRETEAYESIQPVSSSVFCSVCTLNGHHHTPTLMRLRQSDSTDIASVHVDDKGDEAGVTDIDPFGAFAPSYYSPTMSLSVSLNHFACVLVLKTRLCRWHRMILLQ